MGTASSIPTLEMQLFLEWSWLQSMLSVAAPGKFAEVLATAPEGY
jgi:hypothetical protein